MKTDGTKSLEYSESSSQREVYCNKGLPLETRKISNKQQFFTVKRTKRSRIEGRWWKVGDLHLSGLLD